VARYAVSSRGFIVPFRLTLLYLNNGKGSNNLVEMKALNFLLK
jgi:hypothetical protein